MLCAATLVIVDNSITVMCMMLLLCFRKIMALTEPVCAVDTTIFVPAAALQLKALAAVLGFIAVGTEGLHMLSA